MRKIVSFVFVMSFCFIFGQQKGQLRKVATIGFMNVENLWDTIASADFIDGTKDVSNPAFHRSVPLDSLKYLETTEEYRGEWRDDLLKGKANATVKTSYTLTKSKWASGVYSFEDTYPITSLNTNASLYIHAPISLNASANTHPQYTD